MNDATFTSRFPEAKGAMAIAKTRGKIVVQVFDPEPRVVHEERDRLLMSVVFTDRLDEMLKSIGYQRTGKWEERRFGLGKVMAAPVRAMKKRQEFHERMGQRNQHGSPSKWRDMSRL